MEFGRRVWRGWSKLQASTGAMRRWIFEGRSAERQQRFWGLCGVYCFQVYPGAVNGMLYAVIEDSRSSYSALSIASIVSSSVWLIGITARAVRVFGGCWVGGRAGGTVVVSSCGYLEGKHPSSSRCAGGWDGWWMMVRIHGTCNVQQQAPDLQEQATQPLRAPIMIEYVLKPVIIIPQ
jgi:hypothetical protein